MEENTYPNMLLSNLTLPHSSPPIITTSDSSEPVDGNPSSPLSVSSWSLEDKTDIPDQQQSNGANSVTPSHYRGCSFVGGREGSGMTPPRYGGRALIIGGGGEGLGMTPPHYGDHTLVRGGGEGSGVTPPHYRGRALVGGEGSNPGVYLSSPVLSKEDRKWKAKAKKDNTWKLKRHQQEQQIATKQMEGTQLKTERQQRAIANALQNLEDASVTFADLCLYVFNPDNTHITSGWCWDNFYKRPEDIDQILTWMVSKPNSRQARRFVRRGMIVIMEKVVADEADRITKAGVLRPPAEIDASYVLGMKFNELPQMIQVNCPTMFHILMGIAKTHHQENECTPVRLQHKSLVSAASHSLAYMC